MRPEPAPTDPLTLLCKRVHEVEGRGRRAFALFQSMRHPGPLVWIIPSHAPELPMLRGLPQGVGERLHILRPVRETDLLWCVEEALRNVTVGLVIAEPSNPMSLTVGRRFQLAAEAGHSTGLMLIREDAGSNATETRWMCEPLANQSAGQTADSTLHRWSLNKNKKGTLGDWIVDWNVATAVFHLVAEARERLEPAGTAR